MLYGANQGKPVEALPLPKELAGVAAAGGWDLQAYRFGAAPEQLRPPRIVRIGLVQHEIQAPTTAPYAEQRQVSRDGRLGAGCAAISFLFARGSLTAMYVSALLLTAHPMHMCRPSTRACASSLMRRGLQACRCCACR